MLHRIVVIGCLLISSSQAGLADASGGAPLAAAVDAVPSEIVLRVRPETPADTVASLVQAQGGKVVAMNPAHGYYRVSVEKDLEKAAFSLQLNPSILSSRPNYLLGKVAGDPITLFDLELMVDRMIPAGRIRFVKPDARPELLDEVVDTKLFARAARAEKLDHDPLVRKQVEEAVERTLARAYRRRIREAASVVSAQDVAEYYADNAQTFARPEQVKGRAIRVKSERDAKEILALLRAGGDFARLARERSVDKSAPKGGAFDWADRARLPRAAAEQAFALDVGAVSEVIALPSDFLILKIEDKRAAETRPLSAVEDRVRAQLRTARVEEALERKKRELVERYEAAVYPAFLEAMNVAVDQGEVAASLPELQKVLKSAIETPYE